MKTNILHFLEIVPIFVYSLLGKKILNHIRIHAWLIL
jgi:hypothetical protein